jgi:hypothetical protein
MKQGEQGPTMNHTMLLTPCLEVDPLGSRQRIA